MYLFRLQKSRFPFETTNPLGYVVVVVFQYIVFIYAMSILSCLTTFGIDAYMFAVSVTKDITIRLHAVNRCVISEEHQSTIFEHLSDFIQIHSRLKELSN